MKKYLLILTLLFISCSTEPEDCAGTVGGNATIDYCGICDADSTNNNTPLTGICDCLGIPNGDVIVDGCGTCNIFSQNNCTEDCNGVLGGKDTLDCTGACGGAVEIDCAGTCDGSAQIDDCGVCDGDGSTQIDGCTVCQQDAYIDGCGQCDDNPLTDCYDFSLSLHAGANLISFPALPADVSVENIFAGADGVIGEGVGAVNIGDVDTPNWIGSLTEVVQDDGYWVKVSEDTDLSHGDADPVSYDADGEVSYDIHYGNNLISYPFIINQYIADALGDAATNVYALAGEGVAALNTGISWVGSLSVLEGGHGYWLVATDDFSFSFSSGAADGLTRRPEQPALRIIPEVYSFTQSTYQAFFFVKSATISGESLEADDIIIAYNGNVIVGARYWNGEFTDVPAMGADYSPSSGEIIYEGYCETGDSITFKVLDASTGSLVSMSAYGNILWQSMGISIIVLEELTQ